MLRTEKYLEYQDTLEFYEITELCQKVRQSINGASDALFYLNPDWLTTLDQCIYCFEEVINNWKSNASGDLTEKAPCYKNASYDEVILQLVKISLEIAQAERKRKIDYDAKKK